MPTLTYLRSHFCILLFLMLTSIHGVSQTFPLLKTSYFLQLSENPSYNDNRSTIYLNYKNLPDSLEKGGIYHLRFRHVLNKRIQIQAEYDYLDINTNTTHYGQIGGGYSIPIATGHFITLGGTVGYNQTSIGGDPPIKEQSLFFKAGGYYQYKSLTFSFYSPYLASDSRLNTIDKQHVTTSLSNGFVSQLSYQFLLGLPFRLTPSIALERGGMITSYRPQLTLDYRDFAQLGINYNSKKESVAYLGLSLNKNIKVDFSYLYKNNYKRINSLEFGLRIKLGRNDEPSKVIKKNISTQVPPKEVNNPKKPPVANDVIRDGVESKCGIVVGVFQHLENVIRFRDAYSKSGIDTTIYLDRSKAYYFIFYDAKNNYSCEGILSLRNSLLRTNEPLYKNCWIRSMDELTRVIVPAKPRLTTIDTVQTTSATEDDIPSAAYYYADEHKIITNSDYFSMVSKINAAPSGKNMPGSSFKAPVLSEVKGHVCRSVHRNHLRENRLSRPTTNRLIVAIEKFQKQVLLFNKSSQTIKHYSTSSLSIVTILDELADQLSSAKRSASKVKKGVATYLTHCIDLLNEEITNAMNYKEISASQFDYLVLVRNELSHYIEVESREKKAGIPSSYQNYFVGSATRSHYGFPDYKIKVAYQFSERGSAMIYIKVLKENPKTKDVVEVIDKYKIQIATPIDQIKNKWRELRHTASTAGTTLFPAKYYFRVVDKYNSSLIYYEDDTDLGMPTDRDPYTVLLHLQEKKQTK